MSTVGAYLLAPAPIGRALADPTEPTAPHLEHQGAPVSPHKRPVRVSAARRARRAGVRRHRLRRRLRQRRQRRRRPRRRERRGVPRRPLRGQPGRRHHHVPVELRLRRGCVDRRGAGRRGARVLRRAVPRRRHPAQLLDRQLPARRRQRRAVLVGRIVQRDRHVRPGQRGRLRRARGRGTALRSTA